MRMLEGSHQHRHQSVQDVFELQFQLVQLALKALPRKPRRHRDLLLFLLHCRFASSEPDVLETRILDALTKVLRENPQAFECAELAHLYSKVVVRSDAHSWHMQLFISLSEAVRSRPPDQAALESLLQVSCCTALLLPTAPSRTQQMISVCKEFFCHWHDFYHWCQTHCTDALSTAVVKGVMPAIMKLSKFIERCGFVPQPLGLFREFIPLLEEFVVAPIISNRAGGPINGIENQALLVLRVLEMHQHVDAAGGLDVFLRNIREFWLSRINQRSDAKLVLLAFKNLIAHMIADMNGNAFSNILDQEVKGFIVAMLELILRTHLNTDTSELSSYLEWLIQDAMKCNRPDIYAGSKRVWNEVVCKSDALDLGLVQEYGFFDLFLTEVGKGFIWPPFSRVLSCEPTQILPATPPEEDKEAVDIAQRLHDDPILWTHVAKRLYSPTRLVQELFDSQGPDFVDNTLRDHFEINFVARLKKPKLDDDFE